LAQQQAYESLNAEIERFDERRRSDINEEFSSNKSGGLCIAYVEVNHRFL